MSLSSSASNSPRTLKEQSQNLGLIACAGRPAPKDSNEDAASSSQAWQSDGNLNSSAGRLAPTGKSQRVIDRDWPRNFEISASVVEHLEKVYSNFRPENWSPARGRNSRSQCELVDVENVYVGRWMQPFILVRITKRNLHLTKNTEERKIKQLVRRVTEFYFESRRNIRDIKMDWDILLWQRTTLLSDRGVQLSTAKVYVFSDSVLCLGKIQQHPEAVDAWNQKIQWFTNSF